MACNSWGFRFSGIRCHITA